MKKLSILTIFAFVLTAAMISPALAQDSSTEVGVLKPGLNTIEMIGRIDQELFSATTFGYITYVAGVAPEQLFSPEASPLLRGEAEARFTFYGTGSSASRSVYENIFASNVTLEITFYYSEVPVGASFDDPESFKQGTPIVVQTIRMQTILNVQEPNVGVLMGYGEGTQSGTTPFILDGAGYTLGHDGMIQKFNLFGQGFRQSEDPLAAQYLYAGNATVIAE